MKALDLQGVTLGGTRCRTTLLDDWHDISSTIVTSQLPIDKWHAIIVDPTLDRLVHNAYEINLKGESVRKKKTRLTTASAWNRWHDSN
ncbi:hypothetical protein BOW51_10045 [Solemya velesiana gill symbiont]|uniref:IstB-like ATP-binding domain-containing protein n=1 Tax=Solemya velesiana gill symbiont TaxID=1918948 RepID=A0A1T2KSJ2_9GAMM|nr:hypothetical protein BOW51_10045 [Solemya velesiana gill symbiont]